MSTNSNVAIFVPGQGIKYLAEEEAQELFNSIPSRLKKIVVNMSAMAIVSIRAAAELRSAYSTSPQSPTDLVLALEEGIRRAGANVEEKYVEAALKFKRMTPRSKAALISLWMS